VKCPVLGPVDTTPVQQPATAAAGEKIIRLEVVRGISSAFHKPALIREVLYGCCSFLMPVSPPSLISYLTHQLDNESTTHLDTFIILKYDTRYLKLCVQVQNLILSVLYDQASV
jgi:hypothetical protein